MKIKKFLQRDSNESTTSSMSISDKGVKKLETLKKSGEKEVKHSAAVSLRRDSTYNFLPAKDVKSPTIKPKNSRTVWKERQVKTMNTLENESQCRLLSNDSLKKRKMKSSINNDKKAPVSDKSLEKSKKKKQTDKTLNNLDSSINDPTENAEGSRNSRTIFIGNLPIPLKKKKLMKLLKIHGAVEKMWTRGAIPAMTKLPKKVAINKNSLPIDHPPLMAYAVFNSTTDAQNALKLNGEMFEENRLRVTLSCQKKYDIHKGVFVGNLPFSIKEDELYELFSRCGDITGVRIVRDANNGIGKGFGYVNFKSVDAVELALNLNDEKLNGREIRVQRLLTTGKKKKLEKKKGKELIKSDSSKNKISLSEKISKIRVPAKSFRNTETKIKKKNKFSRNELKKKIMAKKLSYKSKKETQKV